MTVHAYATSAVAGERLFDGNPVMVEDFAQNGGMIFHGLDIVLHSTLGASFVLGACVAQSLAEGRIRLS